MAHPGLVLHAWDDPIARLLCQAHEQSVASTPPLVGQPLLPDFGRTYLTRMPGSAPLAGQPLPPEHPVVAEA